MERLLFCTSSCRSRWLKAVWYLVLCGSLLTILPSPGRADEPPGLVPEDTCIVELALLEGATVC